MNPIFKVTTLMMVTLMLPISAFAKDTVAILDFTASNASPSDASTMSQFVRQAVVRSGAYIVVDKKNMDKLLAEQAFQQTGCTSQDCAVKLGKMLNVKKMIVGEFSVLMEMRYLTASLVDVETSQIERTAKVKDFTGKDADTAADRLVAQLIGVAPAAQDGQIASAPRNARGPILRRGRFAIGIGVATVGATGSAWVKAVSTVPVETDHKTRSAALGMVSYRTPFRDGGVWGIGLELQGGVIPDLVSYSNLPAKTVIIRVQGTTFRPAGILYFTVTNYLSVHAGGGYSLVGLRHEIHGSAAPSQFPGSGSTNMATISRPVGLAGLEFLIGNNLGLELEISVGPEAASPEGYPTQLEDSIRVKLDPLSIGGGFRYNF